MSIIITFGFNQSSGMLTRYLWPTFICFIVAIITLASWSFYPLRVVGRTVCCERFAATSCAGARVLTGRVRRMRGCCMFTRKTSFHQMADAKHSVSLFYMNVKYVGLYIPIALVYVVTQIWYRIDQLSFNGNTAILELVLLLVRSSLHVL